MKKAIITDVTLRKGAESTKQLNFKEKTDAAKLLDALGVDVIELGEISDRADVLFLHTISPVIKGSVLSCSAGLSEESAKAAFDALSETSKKSLYIPVPASTVQMEYLCGKKAAAMLETVDIMTKKCAEFGVDTQLVLIDATRAEKDFLVSAINTALRNGVKAVTVCDTAGDMLPDEMEAFVRGIIDSTDIDENVSLFVEVSDKLGLATSLAISAIKGGACGIKAGFCSCGATDLVSFASVLSTAGDRLGFATGTDMTAVRNTSEKIAAIVGASFGTGISFNKISGEIVEDGTVLSGDSTSAEIARLVEKLGYELSSEDISHVYEEFQKVAAKKTVVLHELDAIVAASAIQVPSTYKLKSYVINTGNVISATAHIELLKGDEVFSGISAGDGPVDAAFRAIEQIVGHHYDLDDFQIQALTEGREAVGSSIVKLRSQSGKLYPGKGVSTDIMGAAIKAYISALNKICHEEH